MTNPNPHPCDGFDLFTEAFGQDAPAQWAKLRQSGCPVAHTAQRGGAWLLAGYDDIFAVANDAVRWSSRAIEVSGEIPEATGGLMMPPVTSDPPEHALHRAIVEPYFTVARVAALEEVIRQEARRCAQAIAARGGGDAVQAFARPIALRALTTLLHVPLDMQERFVDWALRVIRFGPHDKAARSAAITEALADLGSLLDQRTHAPGDDVVSALASATLNGQAVSRKHKLGCLLLIVLGGADTTWSTMGASIWHLAQHPQDRARLLQEPKLLRTTAVEEFLRAFAPLSDARIAKEPVELHGRHIAEGERLVLAFAAANRDPAVFEAPDQVDIERKRNRHLAFGTGEHRCLGAPLARLEMRVAIEEWLAAMPEFELDDAQAVSWTLGQIRGPQHVHVRVQAAGPAATAPQ